MGVALDIRPLFAIPIIPTLINNATLLTNDGALLINDATLLANNGALLANDATLLTNNSALIKNGVFCIGLITTVISEWISITFYLVPFMVPATSAFGLHAVVILRVVMCPHVVMDQVVAMLEVDATYPYVMIDEADCARCYNIIDMVYHVGCICIVYGMADHESHASTVKGKYSVYGDNLETHLGHHSAAAQHHLSPEDL